MYTHMGIGRLALALMALILGYVLSGCAQSVNAYTVTQYQSDDYQVLGLVQAKAETLTVLGVCVGGPDGQALLFENARDKFGDKVTGIKDTCSHKEFIAVLPPIFSKTKTTYIGMAVYEK